MMHPVLQIQEILLNIFGYDHPKTSSTSNSYLLALARTCRAFKEPALDILWESLLDPSPLARCLPEASSHRPQKSALGDKCYSFSRSLTQNELDILRSYTRRIRSMSDMLGLLDWESVATSLNPPTTEPLFPNLRHLYCASATAREKLLYMPFPSLITLTVDFGLDGTSTVFRRAFESFSKFSPNIRTLDVDIESHDVESIKLFLNYSCLWRNLQYVGISVTLNDGALVQLSHMAALTRLTLTLSTTPLGQIIPSNSPLIFPSLHRLSVDSKFLEPISQLLSCTQLPAVTHLYATIERCPSDLDVSSFLSNIQALGIGRTIQELVLEQMYSDDYEAQDVRSGLALEDLLPCATFSNLRRMTFDVEWDVDLTSSDMLALVLAWPHMQELTINAYWGWNMGSGITPDGLVQLLQNCRSLSYIAVAIDTYGHTTSRPSPASLELISRPSFCLNVADSFIEEESVPAMAAFLATFITWTNFSFYAWDCWAIKDLGSEDLWRRAYKEARAAPHYPQLSGFY